MNTPPRGTGGTVAVDFDGVLHKYAGWRDGTAYGPPVEGAQWAVQQIQAVGHRVVVHTTRDPEVVRAWLAKHGFPELEVTSEKPLAIAYIDDRAVPFDGDWPKALLAAEALWRNGTWSNPKTTGVEE